MFVNPFEVTPEYSARCIAMLMNEEHLLDTPIAEVVPKKVKPAPNLFNPESWKALDFKTQPKKKSSSKTKHVQKSDDDADDYIEWGAVCKVDASAILEGVAVSAERLGIVKETSRCFQVDHRDQASAIATMFNISSSSAKFESAKHSIDQPSTSPNELAGTSAQPAGIKHLEPTEPSHTKNGDRNQAAANQQSISPNKLAETTMQPAEINHVETEELSQAAGGSGTKSDSGTKAAAAQQSTPPNNLAGTTAQPAEIKHLEPTEPSHTKNDDRNQAAANQQSTPPNELAGTSAQPAGIKHLEPTEPSHTKNGDRNQAAANQQSISPNKLAETTMQPAEINHVETEELSQAAGGSGTKSDSGTKAAAAQQSTPPNNLAGTTAQPAEIKHLEPTEPSHTKNDDRNQAAANQQSTPPNTPAETTAQHAGTKHLEPTEPSHTKNGDRNQAAANQQSTSPNKPAETTAQPAEINHVEPEELSQAAGGSGTKSDNGTKAAEQQNTSPNKPAGTSAQLIEIKQEPKESSQTVWHVDLQAATNQQRTSHNYMDKFAALLQRRDQMDLMQQQEVDGDQRPKIKVEPGTLPVKRKGFFQQVTETVKKRMRNSSHSPESDSDCEVARGIIRELQDDASRERNADCTGVAGNVPSDDESKVPCLMLRENLLGTLCQHHLIVQSYRLKQLPMEIHVIISTNDSSSTSYIGNCNVTECHQVKYMHQLPKDYEQSSQWKDRLRKNEGVYIWMVDELHKLQEPIKLRLTYQKFRNRHFCMPRTALFDSLRVDAPQELSLFHTSWFFLHMLSSSDRERLRSTAENLNGCTLKVGTTCSGTDISVTALKSIIKMMNSEFRWDCTMSVCI